MHRSWSLTHRALVPVLVLALTGCASSTLIRSTPSGATVYIQDERVGTTPYRHTDRRVSFSWVQVRLEKEGYEPVSTAISRDGSFVWSALFLGGFIAPLFYVYGYAPRYDYVLKRARDEDEDLFKWEAPQRNDGTDDLY
ncbi:PEGA domain-containing protein [Pyxidicoccus xibeiensis]|uniref:PEGA domain-containing protein n=1 Tax=Pyxidicoccus xibeiensis TaxID=2906759 RepID=UPI0020A8235C|nr:PEGA domain-containing protein [Pyxidicoccus xibeiensis]MCP3136308.1 PEGA domain-containing protein [Pyxidicoccus xibeiensis]